MAPQQPSLMKQMAATAGGVAMGRVAGSAITGMFSGGSSSSEAAPVQQQPQQEQGPCAWEIKNFIQCAQGQS